MEVATATRTHGSLEAGAFYAPTVGTGVTHAMRIMREEMFGPMLPIVVVDSEVEAIPLANDSDFGLGASVWTSDLGRRERMACELWWHPYDETLGQALRDSAAALYGRSSIRAAALRSGAAALLKLGARLARDAVWR